MEPDRDDFDDAQLLAALDRAWPVPPMTGHLVSREWSSADLTPETGSLAAPLLAGSLPRLQQRRHWQSFTRIAAIVTLLLTSVAGVIAFNSQLDDDRPNISIAAPSPNESGCSLPLRSRKEITQLVAGIKEQIDTGKTTVSPSIEPKQYSTFEVKLDASGAESTVDTMMTEIQHCFYAGVNQVMIEAIGPGIYGPVIASQFSIPNLSVESAVDRIMSPVILGDSPITEMEPPDPIHVLLLRTDDGAGIAALEPDIFGNRYGFLVRETDDGWQWDGLAGVHGEWSSLLQVVDSNGLTPARCTGAMVKSDAEVQSESAALNATGTPAPLIGKLQSHQLGDQRVGNADADAVEAVVHNFRDCLARLVEPYQFAQITPSFFSAFAEFPSRTQADASHQLGYSSLIGPSWVTPSDITSIVSLNENTALALLAVNPEWESLGKTAGIILVKQNGQWLINQLAIVEGPSS